MRVVLVCEKGFVPPYSEVELESDLDGARAADLVHREQPADNSSGPEALPERLRRDEAQRRVGELRGAEEAEEGRRVGEVRVIEKVVSLHAQLEVEAV